MVLHAYARMGRVQRKGEVFGCKAQNIQGIHAPPSMLSACQPGGTALHVVKAAAASHL
jgi:hypothetical protein